MYTCAFNVYFTLPCGQLNIKELTMSKVTWYNEIDIQGKTFIRPTPCIFFVAFSKSSTKHQLDYYCFEDSINWTSYNLPWVSETQNMDSMVNSVTFFFLSFFSFSTHCLTKGHYNKTCSIQQIIIIIIISKLRKHEGRH